MEWSGDSYQNPRETLGGASNIRRALALARCEFGRLVRRGQGRRGQGRRRRSGAELRAAAAEHDAGKGSAARGGGLAIT